MASIIAFRGRNAIIDLTGYPTLESGEVTVVIPGITDTIRNLLKKNYIVWLKMPSTGTTGYLYPVLSAHNTQTAFIYFDWTNANEIVVNNDTLGGSGEGGGE